MECTKTLTVQVVKDGCVFDEGHVSKVLCNAPKKNKTHTNKRLNQNINREVKRRTGEVLVKELDSRDHN